MKVYIKYGILAAILFIAETLFEYFTGIYKWNSYGYFLFIFLLISIFCIYQGIKVKREKELNGFISYATAFNSGMLITLVQSLI